MRKWQQVSSCHCIPEEARRGPGTWGGVVSVGLIGVEGWREAERAGGVPTSHTACFVFHLTFTRNLQFPRCRSLVFIYGGPTGLIQ